jgi:hypothetical protein
VRVGDEAAQGLLAERLGGVALHEHDRGGGVVDAGRVAGRDGSLLGERGRQLGHLLL